MVNGPIEGIVVSPEYAEDKSAFSITSQAGRTTNAGKDWRLLPISNDEPHAVDISPDYSKDKTVAICGYGIQVSTDGGRSWQAGTIIDDNRVEDSWFQVLAFSPNYENDRTIFMGGLSGIYKSTDGGMHWKAL